MKWPILFALATASVGFSAEKKVQLKDLPAAVRQAVQQQSAGATVRGYSVEVENGHTEYEAEMIVNGHGKDVSFDESGKVVAVEEEIALDSVPAPAREAIQKAAAGARIQKVEAVTEKGKSFYEASIRKGSKSMEVQVDSAGNKVR